LIWPDLLNFLLQPTYHLLASKLLLHTSWSHWIRELLIGEVLVR
jgi:hypothetical protein